MKLKDFAKQTMTVSELMKDRERMATKDIVGQKLSLIDFDIISKPDGSMYGVCIFKELPEHFVFAGSVLTNLLIDIRTEYGDKCSELLKEEPLEMVMTSKTSKTPTADGRYNTYTAVELL